MIARSAADPLLPDALLLEVAGGEIPALYSALAQAARWHNDRAVFLDREADHFTLLSVTQRKGKVAHEREAGARRQEASAHRSAAREVDDLARVLIPYAVR